MPQKLIPLSAYARQTDTPESTLRWQIRQGQLHAERLGRYWYVPVEVPERAGLARTFTFFTHAGGAGKTSLVRDLGFELRSRGYRVLLIDADPQANLTAWLGLNPAEIADEATLMQVVKHKVLPTPRPLPLGLDLIPASMGWAMAEMVLPQQILGAMLLRTALQRSGVRERYDYILVDSPPSLGSIAILAALAGEGLIVPIETSPKGVQATLGVIEVAQSYLETLRDHNLAHLSRFIHLFIPTRYDPRTNSDRRVKEALSQIARIAPVAQPISYRPGPYKEASDQAQPVQALGDERLREEIAALADTFLKEVAHERHQ